MSSLRIYGTVCPLSLASSWHGAYFSTGYIFMAWYLVKHMIFFIFTFTFITMLIPPHLTSFFTQLWSNWPPHPLSGRSVRVDSTKFPLQPELSSIH